MVKEQIRSEHIDIRIHKEGDAVTFTSEGASPIEILGLMVFVAGRYWGKRFDDTKEQLPEGTDPKDLAERVIKAVVDPAFLEGFEDYLEKKA